MTEFFVCFLIGYLAGYVTTVVLFDGAWLIKP
jgi:hypothetical protein